MARPCRLMEGVSPATEQRLPCVDTRPTHSFDRPAKLGTVHTESPNLTSSYSLRQCSTTSATARLEGRLRGLEWGTRRRPPDHRRHRDDDRSTLVGGLDRVHPDGRARCATACLQPRSLSPSLCSVTIYRMAAGFRGPRTRASNPPSRRMLSSARACFLIYLSSPASRSCGQLTTSRLLRK
jgi:hypothetical protein